MNNPIEGVGVPRVVRVDLGKSSAVALAIGVPLLLLLSGGNLYAALDAKDRVVTIIGSCFAAVFAVPIVLLLFNLKKLLEPRGLEFDASGIHYFRSDARTTVPWNAVLAVGIGFEQPPEIRKNLADAVVDKRRRLGLEIFTTEPEVFAQHPSLAHLRREDDAPRPDLPRVRLRVPLPPFARLPARIEDAVKTLQPTRWIGWFERRWRPLGGA